NGHGGTLLIGVDDHGQVTGIGLDLQLVHRKDLDGFENWLTTLLQSSIGGAATANASVDFPSMEGLTICRVTVMPSGSPVYVKVKDDHWFYVRLGNSTRRLSTPEAVEYIKQHWG